MASPAAEPVHIVEYDPSWPEQFAAERARIEPALTPWLATGLEHVGSTAVPGLAAKPIIDLLGGMRDLARARDAIPVLAGLGYEHTMSARWAHWFVRRSGGRRTHHLMLIAADGARWSAHLAFRDHLRGHPAAAAEYAALKRELAERFGDDREAFTRAKGRYIAQVVWLASLAGPRSEDGGTQPPGVSRFSAR